MTLYNNMGTIKYNMLKVQVNSGSGDYKFMAGSLLKRDVICSMMTKVTDYESVGRAFESLQAHHKFRHLQEIVSAFFITLTQILTQVHIFRSPRL